MSPPEAPAEFQMHSIKCPDKSKKDTNTMLPAGNQKIPDKITMMKN